jgi:hypothetical protein
MNRSTLMQTQALSSSRSHQARIKLADIAPTSLFDSGRLANKVSLKSPSSDPAFGSPERTEITHSHGAAAAVPHSLPEVQNFMMHVTIDANFVTQLRHLVMGSCGKLVAFMRIQPMAHATKMKVWLCLSKPAVDLVMAAVIRSLPSAEFGRITPA